MMQPILQPTEAFKSLAGVQGGVLCLIWTDQRKCGAPLGRGFCPSAGTQAQCARIEMLTARDKKAVVHYNEAICLGQLATWHTVDK